VEFRVLGPLEAVDGGQAVDLSRRKHRALLAVLLLHVGESLSAERLVEELWGESPPRTAREALVNYVSLLRKQLGPDVLVTRSGGYALDVDPAQIDLVRFERLCAEARTSKEARPRAGLLREGLALWYGPPLADLAYEPFATIEIARLQELRLAAVQDLVDAELELGRHADLVPELEVLIREHPFDERVRGQLMLALYRAGRQAEALEAYQAARRVLDEELGLEPSAPLRELEQAILRHDPVLESVRLEAKAASLRTVTVLFAGVEDAESGNPESVGAAFNGFRAAIERHGGAASVVGDAVIGVFGAPRVHEDDPLRAIRATSELVAARAGVATGEVYTSGDVVTGPPFVLARRFELLAEPGETLLAPGTFRLVRDAVRVGRVRRKGVAGFRLDELLTAAPAIARLFQTPLVGRQAELAALRAAFAEARAERHCVLFTIVGDAGIGKTRVAREFLSEVPDAATVLVGRCVSYGEGATFLPLTEMLGPDLLAKGSTGEIFLAALQRFEELALERPLVLLFEDVHWAESTLLDFVAYLVDRATQSPILVLCLARPDLLFERRGWTASLVLEPLSDDESRELAGGSHADRIVEIAEGNPLYVQQLAAYVAEEGESALDSVPGSIEALLASRFDRLAADERALAQRAAVIGRRFTRSAVAALGPTNALDLLEQDGFVHRGRGAYRFHHVLVRDVVYAGTPKSERAELHERHADWLDGKPEGTDELVGFHLEQAAGYLDELAAPGQQVARLAENAGRRLGAAGIAAWKRGDAAATVNLLGRATALLPERAPERLDLMCELGSALRVRGTLTQAQDVLSLARKEAAAARARRVEIRAEVAMLYIALMLDPSAGTDQLLERALASVPILEEAGDDRALGRSWTYIGVVHGAWRCRYGEAVPAIRRAIHHYDRSGWPSSVMLGSLAAALLNGPTPVGEAIRSCEELLPGADLNGRANLLPSLAALYAMKGMFDKAEISLHASQATFAELDQPLAFEVIAGGDLEARIHLLQGDLAHAQEALERSYAVLRQRGDRSYLPTRAARLAEVLAQRGEWGDARRWLEEAKAGSTPSDVMTEWLWRLAESRLLMHSGECEKAERQAREAIAITDQTDTVNYQADCRVALADVLANAGQLADAEAALREALALYESKGNDVASRQTRSLLDRMTKSP
jgi:DNA-binding SARP family transcriptional activator